MKLLITGGCGFLGSNLAAHAIEKNLEVVAFDNLYREGSLNNLSWLKNKGTFRFVHGDIRKILVRRTPFSQMSYSVAVHQNSSCGLRGY